MISNTPKAPYYAVIFSSTLMDEIEGYDDMAKKIDQELESQEGFLGAETARDGIGITVSYWKDVNSILKWRDNELHQLAQREGRLKWYKAFKLRIAKVERDYGFVREE